MTYRLKQVRYQKATRHILLQNENGPCPLLAAANTLLLRGDMELPPVCISEGVASLDDISNVLAEHALQQAGDHSFHLNELLNIFPTLQDGMDVNPKFTNGVCGMEYTSQLTAFEMLHIEMVHGWLLDPQDVEMTRLIGNRTYNELVELVIAGKDAEAQLSTLREELKALNNLQQQQHEQDTETLQNTNGQDGGETSPSVEVLLVAPPGNTVAVSLSTETLDHTDQPPPTAPPTTTTSDALPSQSAAETKNEKLLLAKELEEKATIGSLIDNYLESTCNQLTAYGLMELYNHVVPDSLCVFFRNNHFCTMTKHEGVLYLLVTDLGYANVPEIMWEKLDSINGDTEYMTPAFIKSSLQSDLLPPPSSSPSPTTTMAQNTQNDYDYQVALELSRGSTTMAESDTRYGGGGGGTVVDVLPPTEPLSQEDADRVAAEQLQAEFDESPESASIALAQKLQQEEYQVAAHRNRRATGTTTTTRTEPNRQHEKSSCIVS